MSATSPENPSHAGAGWLVAGALVAAVVVAFSPAFDAGYVTWDDPVNLMNYVVFVFQKLFGYSREKATYLMLQVHNEGKAVVSNGTREKCEGDVARLHAHGLWATLQKDD